MNISGVSEITRFMADEATHLSNNKVQMEIQMAVIKQTMDQQKAAGEAIVGLIQSTAGSPSHNGSVDIRI